MDSVWLSFKIGTGYFLKYHFCISSNISDLKCQKYVFNRVFRYLCKACTACIQVINYI